MTQETETHEATELRLFMDNDPVVYFNHLVPCFRNAQRKANKNILDRQKLVVLFEYAVKFGAMRYQKIFGTPGDKWYELFPPSVRREVAEHFADYFISEHACGNEW